MPLLRPRVITSTDVQERRAQEGVALEGTTTTDAAGEPYTAKVVKYIPAEIVAAYQTVNGFLSSSQSPAAPEISVGWIVFAAIVTPLWIRYATSDANRGVRAHRVQMYGALLAFLVWAFALGGPWEALTSSDFAQSTRPLLGSLLLVAVTLVMPIGEKALGD
jgi:hypothetical protein